MINTEFKSAYSDHLAPLEEEQTAAEAVRKAVGGEFDAIGKLEYFLLRPLGLSEGDLVVDVGCGSGRLACQLAPLPGIRYIGCDVVPRLLDHARALAGRSDWTFVLPEGTRIPCDDGMADYVLFFSVLTHLLYADSFNYFREAHRCLKPGGLMIFSFLEFQVSCHWSIFIASVDRPVAGEHLNPFVDRAAIHTWAAHAGFGVGAIHDGDRPHIPLPEDVACENGKRMTNFGDLGQSVAVLRKR